MDQNLAKRRAHNFLQDLVSGNYTPENIAPFIQFQSFLEQQKDLPCQKVAVLFICINAPYWGLLKDIIEDVKKNFLPDHKVDFFLWSDIKKPEEIGEAEKILIHNTYFSPYQGQSIPAEQEKILNQRIENNFQQAKASAEYILKEKITIFPTPPKSWPAPTLLRYHLFLQQRNILKGYNYLFYMDTDMRMVNIIGDEILSDKLTAALHPMYALKAQLIPPYEPNSKSTSYIPRPGFVANENGKQRFIPTYFAGGFQGGPANLYLEAAEKISKMIDDDQNNLNYIPIWNDESAWNKYLSENPPSKILTPAYVYPDSLINEYYIPIWGTNYPPKLVTLTKDWSIKLLTETEQKSIQGMKDIK